MPTEQNLPAGANQAELEQHLLVLRNKRTALRRRLDKGVPRSEFARLHALASLIGTAEDALTQVKAQARS